MNKLDWASSSPDILRVGLNKVGSLIVSTVKLPDVLINEYSYETMVFPEDNMQDLYQMQYRTVEEAEHGHKQAIIWAQQKLKADAEQAAFDQSSFNTVNRIYDIIMDNDPNVIYTHRQKLDLIQNEIAAWAAGQ